MDRPAYRFDGVTVFADTGGASRRGGAGRGRRRREPVYRRVRRCRAVRRHPHRARPMDAGRAQPASAAPARHRRRGRHRALRVAPDGRGGDADDPAQPGAGLARRDSALVLLHGPAREPAALVRRRGLGVDARVPARGPRAGARRHAVPVAPAARRRPVGRRPGRANPVRRLDALALPDRCLLRARDVDLGLQRPAVDGALRLDHRARSRRPAGCAGRRAGGPGSLPGLGGASVAACRWRGCGQGDRAAANRGRSLLRRAGWSTTGRRCTGPGGGRPADARRRSGQAGVGAATRCGRYAGAAHAAVRRGVAAGAADGGGARRSGDRFRAAGRIRRLLLCARLFEEPAGAAAGAARQVRRPAGGRGSTSIPRWVGSSPTSTG